MKTIEPIGTLSLSELQTGDVILVDSHSFLGNAIDIFQENRFNHAAFFFKYDKLDMLYEAVRTGAGFNLFSGRVDGYYQKEYDYDKYVAGDIDIIVLRLKKNNWGSIDKSKLLVWMMLHSTDGYSLENLFIWQPFKYIWKWITGKEKWIGKNEKNKYICGQLVAKIYNVFLGHFEGQWEKIAPVDLFESELFNHYYLRK